MKTFVLWTHYDCEVYVTLHATAEHAWQTLKEGWLDDCDDDCGHVPDEMTIEEIAEAVEYHFDELMYNIDAYTVPIPTTAEQTLQNAEQLTAERVERPDSERMANEKADELLARFRTFKESS